MKVVVRAPGVNLHLRLPLRIGVFVMKRLPEAVYMQMGKDIPAPYDSLMNRETLGFLLDECMEAVRSCRGIEIVHVEQRDGTYVSISL